MIIPIGRETFLARFPWATTLLMAVTGTLFFLTWPAEKAFLSARWPDSSLVTEAKALTSLALDDGPTLPAESRSALEDLRAQSDFPDREADNILESIQKNFDYLPTLKRPDWDLHYAAYVQARKEVTEQGVPWSSVLSPYTLQSGELLWPRLLTHFWFHAGYFHFLFTLFFLWLAGAQMEPVWGFFWTLVIYVGGGAVSAFTVTSFLPGGDWVLVGGSGAAAALFGGMLSRQATAPVRFFYVLGIAYGFFSLPAWVFLGLWGWGVRGMGWMTDGRLAGPAAYWFHGAGLAYGLVVGWIAGRGGSSEDGWDRSLGGSPLALDKRAESAGRLFTQGKAEKAREMYQAVLAADPSHLAALQGLIAAQEFFHEEEEAARTSVRLIRVALEKGRGQLAEEVFRKWSMRLFQTKLPAQERLMLAQNLETLQLWREALAYYRAVAEQAKDSPFAGKALFASAKIYKDQFKKPDDAVNLFRQLLDPPYDLEWRSLAETELRILGKL